MLNANSALAFFNPRSRKRGLPIIHLMVPKGCSTTLRLCFIHIGLLVARRCMASSVSSLCLSISRRCNNRKGFFKASYAKIKKDRRSCLSLLKTLSSSQNPLLYHSFLTYLFLKCIGDSKDLNLIKMIKTMALKISCFWMKVV